MVWCSAIWLVSLMRIIKVHSWFLAGTAAIRLTRSHPAIALRNWFFCQLSGRNLRWSPILRKQGAVPVVLVIQGKINMSQEHASNLNASIFRAYDIRGIVGETLTEETVFLIGKAVGSLVREKGEQQITIARD